MRTININHPCQFGSGATLVIVEQSAHAVIVIRERGLPQASAAYTPVGLRLLADAILRMADRLDAKAEGRS